MMIEMNKNIAVKPNSYTFSFQKFDLTNGTGGCSTYCIRKTTLTLLLKGVRLMNLTSVTVKEKRVRNKSQLIALLETNNGISSARGKNANEDLKPLKTSDHCQ